MGCTEGGEGIGEGEEFERRGGPVVGGWWELGGTIKRGVRDKSHARDYDSTWCCDGEGWYAIAGGAHCGPLAALLFAFHPFLDKLFGASSHVMVLHRIDMARRMYEIEYIWGSWKLVIPCVTIPKMKGLILYLVINIFMYQKINNTSHYDGV